jgi:hypothetical protein
MVPDSFFLVPGSQFFRKFVKAEAEAKAKKC